MVFMKVCVGGETSGGLRLFCLRERKERTGKNITVKNRNWGRAHENAGPGSTAIKAFHDHNGKGVKGSDNTGYRIKLFRFRGGCPSALKRKYAKRGENYREGQGRGVLSGTTKSVIEKKVKTQGIAASG